MGSNGSNSGVASKRSKGGKQLPVPTQKPEQKKEQATNKKEKQSLPKTIKLGNGFGGGKRVNTEKYIEGLRKDPIPKEMAAEINKNWDGNKAQFAIHALIDHRMDDIGVNTAMYTYPQVANAWFRSMLKMVHPDSNNGSRSSARATDILTDMHKRMLASAKS